MSVKKVKLANNIADGGNFLPYKFLPSFDNFSYMAHENTNYLFDIKENLLTMTDNPSPITTLVTLLCTYLIKSPNGLRFISPKILYRVPYIIS